MTILVEINEPILGYPSGHPVDGAVVTITRASDGSAATHYDDDQGNGASTANPVTVNGQIPYWWEPDDYDITDQASGVTRRVSALSSRAIPVATGSGRPAPAMPLPALDALVSKSRSELRDYLDWLVKNNVRGDIGELGWPHGISRQLAGIDDSDLWRAWGESIWQTLDDYDAVVRQGLPVIWFNATEGGVDYTLNAYGPSGPEGEGGAVDTVNKTGYQLEAHLRQGGRIAYSLGGSTGFPFINQQATSAIFSNTREPWTWELPAGADGYNYGSQDTYNFLASRGIRVIRLSFRWERVQRTISGALDATEMGRIDQALTWIAAAGMQAILVPHNFAAYWLDDGTQGVKQIIGSAAVPASAFYDLWTKLSQRYQNNAAVLGYDLMNEPVNVTAANWHTYSQGALNAIRANGDNKLIMVEGSSWAPAKGWAAREGAPWITDSGSNFRYSAHYYPDASGIYASSYASMLSDAQTRGWSAPLGLRNRFPNSSAVQTTVGKAGSAAAAPSAPAKWLKIVADDGQTYVVPAFKALTYSAAILGASGLQGYLRLGEASGTQATDASPNARHATYTNAPTLGAAGLLVGDADTAASFDGVNDYVDWAALTQNANADFTIGLWCKPTALGTRVLIAQRDGTGIGRSLLWIDGTSGQFASSLGNVTNKSGFTPVANTIYFVAVTYDQGAQTLTFYVNGAPTAVVTSVAAETANGGWVVGASKTFANPFQGVIDEVAVYNRVLTADEIRQRYTLGT